MFFRIILFLLFASTTTFAKDVVTIGTFPYPPYHTEEGGFLNDFYEAIFKAVNTKVKFVHLPLRRSEVSFLKGKVDLFSSHVLISRDNINLTDRLDILKFSPSFFFLKTKGDFTNLKSLKDFVCGVIQNTPYTKLYEANSIKLNYLKDPETLVKMTILERITAFESTFLTGVNYIQKNKMVSKFDYFVFDVLSSGPASLKSNEKGVELLGLVDKGYKLIVENGELINILEKYWGSRNIPRAILPHDLKHLGVDQPVLKMIPLSI